MPTGTPSLAFEPQSTDSPSLASRLGPLFFAAIAGRTLAARLRILLFLTGWMTGLLSAHGGELTPAQFDKGVRPVLKQYCLGCHSTEKHKGDLDLERFTTLDEVLKHPKPWQTVVEQLSLGEMPPQEKPQPTAAERE